MDVSRPTYHTTLSLHHTTIIYSCSETLGDCVDMYGLTYSLYQEANVQGLYYVSIRGSEDARFVRDDTMIKAMFAALLG